MENRSCAQRPASYQFALYAIAFAATAASLALSGPARASDLNSMPMKVPFATPLRAEPFDLNQVRLLDGPFLHAQEMDHRYLLSLDPDRLLRSFRINAGLPTTAKPLGGWEAPDSEVRGHFVGHYLSACAMMFRSTGDTRLKANADRVVAGMAECQSKMGTGYLSAFPESFIDRVIARKPVWAPWYTIHKIYAGLLDMYLLTGNRQALQTLEKAAAWAKRRTDPLTEEQMQRMLDEEQGGMNEVLANLYAVTGNKDDLALSLRFNHHAVLDPLAQQHDELTGLHANTQFPKVIGVARQYELTGDPASRTTARFFWDVVTKDRSYVTGGNSDYEHFSPKEELSKHLSPDTTETCNTYNMLKLTRHLFCWDPQAEYADYTERALYNHILASQNPETGMMVYYLPLKNGVARGSKTPFGFCTPEDSFWCCTGTGVENHAKYGDSIYFHDGTAGLYLNLFIPSELNWREKGISVRQETRIPAEGATRLTFTCNRPTRLALHVRHPAWAGDGFAITVNGKAQPVESAPGSYAVITRTWRTGDTLDVSLPMRLHTEGFKDNPDRVALLYGPIVLCADTAVGDAFAAIRTDSSAASPTSGEDRVLLPASRTRSDPTLLNLAPEPGQPLRFTGSPAVFRTGDTVGAAPVEFLPFYEEYQKPTVVYWDAMNDQAWTARETARRAELARQQALDARTIDSIEFRRVSEQAHHLASESSGAGDYDGRRWRDAGAGGWFSFDLKVLPDQPIQLLASYWGSDTGGREFDVLVDGTKIASQTLDNNRPGEFFDVVYPIPIDLTKAKDHITVRFQGHPGRMTGGVFGCRTMKAAGG